MTKLGKLLLISFLVTLQVIAADNDVEYGGLHFENDVFAGTDRYYTHATRFDFMFAVGHTPGWWRWWRDVLQESSDSPTILGLFMAQYLYTPPDIEIEDPTLDQRPYAGWLHLGLLGSSVRDHKLSDTVSINLGVIGPSAGGETSQREVHEIINSPLPWAGTLNCQMKMVEADCRRNHEEQGPTLPTV